MLVTPQTNRQNQRLAIVATATIVLAFAVIGWFLPWFWLGITLGPLVLVDAAEM